VLAGARRPRPRPAGAADPTDMVRVDDYIGAPRALFGRADIEVERTLSPPRETESGRVPSFRDPVDFRPARRLFYPGLVIEVLETGRLRRVRIGAPGCARLR
jgi:hypothetical protein